MKTMPREQTFIEASLTACPCYEPEDRRMAIRYSEISKGGYGFTVDLWEDGAPALSCGMLATESVFISLYLLQVCGRKPTSFKYSDISQSWQTKLLCRFYNGAGGTDASAAIWVEQGAIWIGLHFGEIIAKARLDEIQLKGMMRLADAMEKAFK